MHTKRINRKAAKCPWWVLLFPMVLASTGVVGEEKSERPIFDRVCRIHFGPVRPTVIKIPRKPLYGLTPEALADQVADTGLEVWYIPLGWGSKGVFFDSSLVAQCSEIPGDTLPRIFKRAHERGLKVAVNDQMSEVECMDKQERMKEWVLHPIDDGADTKPEPREWQRYPGVMSYAADAYREWKGQFLSEAVRMLNVDGFGFDAAAFASGLYRNEAGDVGPHGQKKYLEETGKTVPVKVDWTDRAFKEWVNWRYEKTTEFFTSMAESAAKENPDIALFINYYYAGWASGHPLRPVEEKSRWFPTFEAESSFKNKIARALSPRSEVWMWAEWFVPEVAHGQYPYFNPDRAIARGLRVISNGLAPCLGGWSADFDLMTGSLKTIFDEFKLRRDYRTQEMVKHAGLLVSQQTRDFGQPEDFWTTVDGIHEMHLDEHVLTDVLFDNALTDDGLAAYSVVILSDATCLSDAQCDVLRKYVRKGGTLVATMESSLYNEWGEKRDNFALADLFGVDYRGTTDEAGRILVPQTSELKQQYGRLVGVVARATDIRVAEGADTEVLWTLSPRDTINGLCVQFEPYDSDVPAIVKNSAGRGAAYYLAFDAGAAYIKNKLPRMARLFTELTNQPGNALVEIEAPPNALEVTAFRDGPGRMYVHLVNCTALSFNEMAPLADIDVTVHGRRLARAMLPISGSVPRVEGNTVTIPTVGYGEVLVLELR